MEKIKAGSYKGANGTVRNVFSDSGAPHTRHARAKWLVELNIAPTKGPKVFFVPSLARAREILDRK